MPRPVALPIPSARRRSGRKPHGPVAATLGGHMLDQIGHEGPDQPDGQHLDPEGPVHQGTARHRVVIGRAELARAVDGGGAHQVADLVDARGVGLLPLGKALDHMLPQPARAIGARQDQLAVADAAGLLLGHVARKPFDVRGLGLPVHQREGRVPGLRDHPVGAQVIGQVMGEGDEAVGLPLPRAR
jgi:hypothetical protein